MEFKYHVLTGAIVSYLITLIFNLDYFDGAVIFLASVLIDIDHYFWYVFETKDPNPLNAIGWYIKFGSRWKEMPEIKRREYKKGIFIFHNWICWTILLILGYLINQFFYLVLIGFAIHIIPDLLVLKKEGAPISQKISIRYSINNNKGKKGIKEYNKYFKKK